MSGMARVDHELAEMIRKKSEEAANICRQANQVCEDLKSRVEAASHITVDTTQIDKAVAAINAASANI